MFCVGGSRVPELRQPLELRHHERSHFSGHRWRRRGCHQRRWRQVGNKAEDEENDDCDGDDDNYDDDDENGSDDDDIVVVTVTIVTGTQETMLRLKKKKIMMKMKTIIW